MVHDHLNAIADQTGFNMRIGIAGPPVRHPPCWLLFYHAVDKINAYRLGVDLLDYENPRRCSSSKRS